MTREEAKIEGFTHKGNMYNCIPAYFIFVSDEEFHAAGTNSFFHGLIWFFSWIDNLFGLEKSSELEITEEL